MHVQGNAVVDHRKDERAHRRVDRSQPLLTKSVPENSLETKLSTNPNVNLLTRGRPYGSSNNVSIHNNMKTCTSNEFSYKMKGKITGWGEFRTCPNAPGPKSCTIRCIKWIFLLTVTRTLICCVKWKLLNTGAAWLFINKRSNKLKVFTQPSSVGAPKMKTQKRGDKSQRTGLVHARRPKWGVSLFVKSKQSKGAPPCFLANKETLSCNGWSLSHGMESSQLATT